MTAPAVTSIAYDKAAYNPGDLITVTVLGTAGSSLTTRNVAANATLTDVASGAVTTFGGLLSLTSPVEDATTAAFTDGDGRVYAQKSLAQTPAGVVTAVFTATA